jgi:hypothetical protein
MIIQIAEKPHLNIHSGLKSPATGDYDYISADEGSIIARNNSDNTIDSWAFNKYDFTYITG